MSAAKAISLQSCSKRSMKQGPQQHRTEGDSLKGTKPKSTFRSFAIPWKPRAGQEKAPHEDGSAVLLESQKKLLLEVKAKPNSRNKPFAEPAVFYVQFLWPMASGPNARGARV